MFEFALTPENLAALAGIFVSGFFAYFPWVSKWYDGLDSQFKPLIQAGVLLAVAWGYLLYGCKFQFDCINLNANILLDVYVRAIIANIGTYFVAVRQIKQARKAKMAK